MKRIYTALVLILLSYCSYSQDATSEKHKAGKIIIKWSPAHLFSHFSSVQLALEHKLTSNVSVQYDFGPVLNVGGILSTVDSHKHGYRAKFQVRRYFESGSRHWKYFVAPEVGYNSVNYRAYRAYYVDAENQFDYYQFIETPSTYREKSMALYGGARFNVYRFCVEFQAGLAERFIKFHNDSPGSNYTLSTLHEKDIVLFDNKSRNVLLPTAAIRVCYIIR